MPRIEDIQTTPNPNARKFILREPLTWGVTRSYENAVQAQNDSLASALFAIGHVTNVFYVDHWITVTQDGDADWDDLLRQLAPPIRAAFGADAQTSVTVESASLLTGNLTSEERHRLEQINALLDERVRPYLQGDGGDLHVIGLQGKRLTVHYQGACGSCPSSLSGTLVGIESMVKELDPELEVVAV